MTCRNFGKTHGRYIGCIYLQYFQECTFQTADTYHYSSGCRGIIIFGFNYSLRFHSLRNLEIHLKAGTNPQNVSSEECRDTSEIRYWRDQNQASALVLGIDTTSWHGTRRLAFIYCSHSLYPSPISFSNFYYLPFPLPKKFIRSHFMISLACKTMLEIQRFRLNHRQYRYDVTAIAMYKRIKKYCLLARRLVLLTSFMSQKFFVRCIHVYLTAAEVSMNENLCSSYSRLKG